jgi:ribonuclease BN (tRNA processing enzyme)
MACDHTNDDDLGCCSRLGFLARAAATSALSAPIVFFPSRARAQVAAPAAPSRTKAILLGTAGGPGIRGVRQQPSTAIVVDGVPYIVDCGNGVARQMVAAGLPLTKLSTILVTHHHSDHIADYGALMLVAWGNGNKAPIRTFGPPPLAKMTDLAWQLYARDIDVRMSDEGRPDLRKLVTVHEIAEDGLVFQDERVKVTAAIVNHGAMKPALAYRFDTPDRSIVVSGDTTFDRNLIRLALGADVLIHEAMYMPGLDRLLAIQNNAPTLREHLLSAHTTTEDVGRVANDAGVKSLVLTHLVPAYDPRSTDADWIASVATTYGGPITMGRDLLVV